MRLTPHNYSPSVLGKIVRSCAREPSFEGATEALDDLAELTISSRQASRIAQDVGQQLQADRDDNVEQYQASELKPRVEMRPALAVVGVDGGRLQIRGEGDGPGSHDPSWREDKIALLATAAISVSDSDPEPDLPDCFRDQKYVEKLLRGIGGQGPMSQPDAQADSPADSTPTASEEPADTRKRPELLVRTYVASTCTSEQFGPMVAAAAQCAEGATHLSGTKETWVAPFAPFAPEEQRAFLRSSLMAAPGSARCFIADLTFQRSISNGAEP